jgi:hypothetical protein
MSVAGSALERCVGVPIAEFADRYWSRAPLFTPAAGTGSGFDDLLDEQAVDALISRHGLRTPFARMARDGRMVSGAAFTRGGGLGAAIGDQLADDKVLGELAGGATLVLQGLHRTWPPLIDFGWSLSQELGHPVQINAYVTPPRSQGFAAHYDTHDVFVLQVAGRKRWSIHSPVLSDPLPDQPWEQRRAEVAARAAEPALLELVLAPGDALYLPRGYLHSATTADDLSVHLTVGVHALSRFALARHLLAELGDDPELRRSLPMGCDLSDPAVVDPLLAQTASVLLRQLGAVDAAHVSRVADRLGEELRTGTRPAPLGPLAQLRASDRLGPSTLVALRPGLRVGTTSGPDGIRLRVIDRTVTLPPWVEPAWKVLAAGDPVRLAELPGLEGLAPDDGRYEAVRMLIHDGVLVVVPDVD